jgi:hypothetical protein
MGSFVTIFLLCATRTILRLFLSLSLTLIRALSVHLAAEFNILPDRWQHVWLVAIVPHERWGKMDRNYCNTAWGSFKTLISSLHYYTNYACSFSLILFLFFIFYFFIFVT